MPRLRNTTTGVVVNVDDETAAQLGQGWEPADAKDAGSTKRPTRGRASSKKDS